MTSRAELFSRSMDPPKTPSDSPSSTWEDEGLEFELTDFGEARRILDDESISQFHVETVVSPAHWKRVRRELLPTDRALGGQAIDWLLTLPPDFRPQHLGDHFPRIANALAAVWHDHAERQAVLAKLLHSDRQGRKGFPPQVQRELVTLHDWITGLRDFNEPF